MKFGSDYYDEAYFTKRGVKGWYDCKAFSLDNVFHKQIAAIINEVLNFKADSKLLEIGCALGNVTYWMNKCGIESWGVDISEYAIEHSHIHEKVKVGDITKEIPYPDNYFSHVFTRETLEHIDSDQVPNVLKEMFRVMRPGGTGLISPANNFGHKEFKKQTNPENTDISHICVRTPYWWADMFEKAGFNVSFRRSMLAACLPMPEQFTWTMLVIEKPQ